MFSLGGSFLFSITTSSSRHLLNLPLLLFLSCCPCVLLKSCHLIVVAVLVISFFFEALDLILQIKSGGTDDGFFITCLFDFPVQVTYELLCHKEGLR